MPTIGADIVGPSSAFDQTDWVKTSPSFLNGKKSLYVSWSSKSDVSDTNNVVWGVGQIGGTAILYFRHNTGNAPAPAAWLIGYVFTDRTVQYKSGNNTGANNKLQRMAYQIQSGVAPQLWIDGVLQTPNAIVQDPTGAGYPTGGLIIQPADELWIGRSVHTNLWDGLVDELRIIEDIKDTNYALTEFRNLSNIDQMVTFGDVETPSSALSPRGELVIAEVTPGSTTRIRVDLFLVNPNPTSAVISAVSVPSSGTAVKVDDANVDYTAGPSTGVANFNVTFTSSGKSVVVPIRINISGTVSVRPPDITSMTLLPDRVTWDYTEPPGFEGYQPREGPDGATWATATNIGVKTSNKYVMRSGLLVPSKKVLVKPYANSLEALNAAEMSLIEAPPPPPGNYWSSPNIGTKARNDVGNHTELMNAIAGINPASAYINMTYVDNSTTTVGRGGTATNPLIITAQAPNGLDNFSGRPGFTAGVVLTADYVWLDRLATKRTDGSPCIDLKGNWKFVTRCQVEAGQGIRMDESSNANECWIGFNRLKGFASAAVSSGTQGMIHIDARGSGSGRPKNIRIYYNILKEGPHPISGEAAGYGIICGPGSKLGSPNTEYGGYNVDGSWVHYNYVDIDRWGFYMKHGMDCMYNHMVGSRLHGISTRGECVSRCKIKYNRVTSEQMSLQGWHHEVVGNIVTTEGIKLGCEFRNDAGTPKFTRGSMQSYVVGNQANLIFGEGRWFDNPNNPVFYAPLHDVLVEKHLGKYSKWNDNSGETSTEIFLDANNKLPVADMWRGKGRLYDNGSIIIKNTTSVVLEAVPTLSETICGPASTRGKVWGT